MHTHTHVSKVDRVGTQKSSELLGCAAGRSPSRFELNMFALHDVTCRVACLRDKFSRSAEIARRWTSDLEICGLSPSQVTSVFGFATTALLDNHVMINYTS